MTVPDGIFQEGAPKPANRSVASVACVLCGDQHLDRFVFETGFPVHFGQLPVWLRFKYAAHLRLQSEPAQASFHVERRARAETVVGKAIYDQVARLRPALFLVEQYADTSAAEINDRAIAKLHVTPHQASRGQA